MVPYDFIKCSLEDFEGLQHVMSLENQRLEEEEYLSLCLEIEYTEGKLFIYAENFGDDSLPENVCSAIGRLLRLSGKEFLEFEYSQTSSRIMIRSHGGGVFRIYNDGSLVYPKIVWPS
jgi:hypothetical protein